MSHMGYGRTDTCKQSARWVLFKSWPDGHQTKGNKMTQIKPNRQIGAADIDMLIALVKTAEGGAMEDADSIVLRMFWQDQIEKLRMRMARQMIKHLQSSGQTTSLTVKQMACQFDLRTVVGHLTSELMTSIIETDYGITLSSISARQTVGAR